MEVEAGGAVGAERDLQQLSCATPSLPADPGSVAMRPTMSASAADVRSVFGSALRWRPRVRNMGHGWPRML